MSDAGAGRTDALAAATRLSSAVEAANLLLYHSISSGQDLPASVRDPIISARVSLERGQRLEDDGEATFLDAYAKLAQRVAPVTAATLDATSRSAGRRGWLGRLLGLRPVSDAQRLASCFGLLALVLITAIAGAEWANTFMGSIATAEKQFAANSQEMRATEIRRQSIEDQIAMLTRSDGSGPDTANAGALREALRARKDEVDARIWALDYAGKQFSDTVKSGYEAIERKLRLSRDEARHIALPLANIVGTFLLPVLYGALGTCAFVMRSLFREMAERSFDGRRTGEFVVRIFLGMLSGLTVQWIVVRSDGTVAGGMTPAVLAFLGGYSVEMLFTAIDRLVLTVAGRTRPPHRSQAAPRPRLEIAEAPGQGARRVRARHLRTQGMMPNGAISGSPAPTPTP
jgi:hypothetical protein